MRPRSGGAGRSGGSPTTSPRCGRPRAAWPTHSRATRPTDASPPAHGATLRERSPVTAIRDAGGGDLEVVTADATYRTGRVVIAADAWTNPLLASFERRLPLTITKEQVTYFACPDPAAFAPDRFPVWIWMDDPCYYGFPTYGEAGPKAAEDCGGRPVDPDRRTFERDETAFRSVTSFLADHLPGALGPPIYTRTCLYTLTPGSRLRGRPAAGGTRDQRRPRCRARLQVRLGHRPDPGRAERRRHAPRRRRTSPGSGSTGRSSSKPIRPRPGWSDARRGAQGEPPFAVIESLCHRTASFGREGPAGGVFECVCPCGINCHASSRPSAWSRSSRSRWRRPSRRPTRSSCASAPSRASTRSTRT